MRFQEILPRVATRFGQSNAKLSKLAVPANPHCLRRRRICKQRSDSVSLGGLLGVLPEAASFGLARHFNEDDETDDLADWEYVRLVDHEVWAPSSDWSGTVGTQEPWSFLNFWGELGYQFDFEDGRLTEVRASFESD